MKVVQDDNLASGVCASTIETQVNSSGVITGEVVVRLGPGWRTYGFNALLYAILHEMGHYLGLDHNPNPCTDDDSVMFAPISSCNATGLTNIPKPSDTIPVNDGVYAGGSEAICGF